MYTARILCQKANISQQSFYRLAKENDDFKSILTDGRTKGAKGYQYSQEVLDWLLKYYEIDTTESNEQSETQDNPPFCQPEAVLAANSIKSLTDERDALKRDLDALKRDLEKARVDLAREQTEKSALLAQNQQILTIFAMEKQEKQQLILGMQEKRVTIGERIKRLIAKNKKDPAGI